MLVSYDGSPAARQALDLAAHMALKNGGYLAVLLVAETPEKEYRLQAETADWLRARGLLVHYRQLEELSAEALCRAVQAEKGGTLILAGTTLPQEALPALLEQIDCPVLLIR